MLYKMQYLGSIHCVVFFLIQYAFTIPRDETEVMLSLYQKDVRDQKGLKANTAVVQEIVQSSGENLTIGFFVMKVRDYVE